MLGWKILKEGEYKIDLQIISEEEEEVIEQIENYYKEHSRENKISEEESEETLRELILKHCESKRIYLDSDQEEYLVKYAILHIRGFMFLEELLKDKEIEEISIIGLNKPAYVFKRNKGWLSVNAMFTNEEALKDVINKMGKTIGRRITLQKPRINAILPDGSRLHASLPPLSQGEITIRRFSEKPFSPKDIQVNNTISLEALAFLSLVMQSDSSLIVAGNTASGKTTTMNALFSFVPMNERVIIIEETPEINVPHPHQLRMVSNEEMEIGLSDLVYDSLRMRPDRTIIGEVRNKKEISALFEIILSGQARGSYATIHGQSLKETIQRIKSFGIEEMDIESIDLIVVQRRMLKYDSKKRKNVELRRVVEIGSPKINSGEVIFKYDYGSDSLKFNQKNQFENLLQEKLGLSKKEYVTEFTERVKLMKNISPEFNSFFSKVQKEFYGLRYVGKPKENGEDEED